MDDTCACGHTAVYYRRHEGRSFCAPCLTRSVETRFRKTVSEHHLVTKGDRIAVALSGGKDSSVLLSLMHRLQKDVPFELVALAVDEGIAGYRDASLAQAREFCAALEIELHCASFDESFSMTIDRIGAKKHCTYCGVFRRTALNRAAKDAGADTLAVGHNLDDEAQSILMNFFRGDYSRFQKLGAGHVRASSELVRRIKPLRDIPEKEIMLYALLNGIPFHRAECPHSFDNLRREVQAFINDMEDRHPGTKHQIVTFYDRLRPMLRNEEKEAAACVRCGEPTSGGVCRACELLAALKKSSAHSIA